MSKKLIKFINREHEQDYLKKHFASDPNAILWISGPKSCGRTSLINKVINELDTQEYAVNFINLRGVMIYNFQTFLDVFFQPQQTVKSKVGKLISGISVNLGFFTIGVDDDVILKKNAFKIMEDQIREAKKRGIQPILIIDEIQTLKQIYLNGECKLIDELFNLFVRLTKETHLAHVVCLTSDSYFMEEIFNNAKLSVTSIFYNLEHFDQQTVQKWLKEESLKTEEIEIMWDFLGGSPWHIWQVLVAFQRGDGDLKDLCENMLQTNKGQLFEFRNYLESELISVFDEVNQTIVKQGFYLRNENEDKGKINQLIKKCVGQDFWFYRSETGKITANSRVVERAMKKILK